MSQQPQGSMLRIWHPGSDPNGPPDEVRTSGNLQPTDADLTEGVRNPAVITEDQADAAE